MIKVKIIPPKGRGVVATTLIAKGTLIEASPVSSFPKEQWDMIRQTSIFKYCFVRLSEYRIQKKVDGYLVFGTSTLCNHSEKPNSYIEWVENELGLWAHLIAKEDIQPNEEVSIFYANINEYSLASKFVT
ncbi:nuclear protein SET [[Leptolyngbya] sp. PCC 7376]|uniref:SET domain-containing protein-lysine N-methyltransferase n=1 Tax=[Leptolyngbya] sp. PCC 7376 TaxID=111781 RepID=UPI00029EDFF7|nr:SET domain-containing protein-lysine N-methyltransferase [[Leptolyngbya] sp. PCC 7376]AFY40141.1 nuclear protein SET [[Leptolyngbya] sp. PCC 7376]